MINFENSAAMGCFVMPREIEKHLKNAGEAELRVILHIFANGGVCKSEKTIAEACGISESEVYGALAFWRGTGLVSYKKDTKPNVSVVSDTPISQRTVSYSPAELAEAMDKNEDIVSLLNYASQKIGKILTPSEQGIIYSLTDALGLGCDLVMGIIEYCCTTLGKKSVRYIERTAIKMHDDDGVDTYEKFEEYMTRKNAYLSYEGKIRRVIGASERSFSAKEKKAVEYLSDNNVSEELLAEAYERTINNISKPSLPYMAKIVESWLNQGIVSAADIEANKPFADINDNTSGEFSLETLTERPDDGFFAESGDDER